ncbi:hypothetical protein BCR34DRAFT_53414 [Clohesyomyces aquaticus]|uniref:Uncharacterized protein n=1 Tax=Clohesyomyces aquaticus TaxID=1231657 RepID=A0A1Y1Z4C1_9PLEO|nr:hypothetical protein BCR34DRAFT_53414 [Clohesyomyces aquaticus]
MYSRSSPPIVSQPDGPTPECIQHAEYHGRTHSSPLLALPREVRDQIWGHIFRPTTHSSWTKSNFPAAGEADSIDSRCWLSCSYQASVLLVNKQVASEYLEIISRKTPVVLYMSLAKGHETKSHPAPNPRILAAARQCWVVVRTHYSIYRRNAGEDSGAPKSLVWRLARDVALSFGEIRSLVQRALEAMPNLQKLRIAMSCDRPEQVLAAQLKAPLQNQHLQQMLEIPSLKLFTLAEKYSPGKVLVRWQPECPKLVLKEDDAEPEYFDFLNEPEYFDVLRSIEDSTPDWGLVKIA